MKKRTPEQSRYQHAHDELEQYMYLMKDKLQKMSSPTGWGSMFLYCVNQLYPTGWRKVEGKSGDWYTTRAQRLESTLDTARGGE